MNGTTTPNDGRAMRVLYSFPGKIGADRIDFTAWQQVNGLVRAGADVLVFPGSVYRELPPEASVRPTLAKGPFRLPYKALGRMRTFELHDKIVARRLTEVRGDIDIVHTWPLGAQHTLRACRRLGIPTVLERPNAHTRFAYEVVRDECERIGVALPADHEHAYNAEILAREETEYALTDYLLCPSEFVVKTFIDRGVAPRKLLRHIYGFDQSVFHPTGERASHAGLIVLFVGVAAVRKGLHFALEAWLKSSASANGKFLIAGEFLPQYEEKLASMLRHPSVDVLGHRSDVAELMRASDALVLPSLEEGFGLVCVEALGSGCVAVVSDACTDLCRHMENALVHPAGDVQTLAEHLTLLNERRDLLVRLQRQAVESAKGMTWDEAGVRLLGAYRHAFDQYASEEPHALDGAA